MSKVSLFLPEMSNSEQKMKSNEDDAENKDLSQTSGSGYTTHISHTNQNNLPPKKRFENQNFNSSDGGEVSSQQILNQESKPEESKTVLILPGVIRHTSCPDNTLAYHYNYNSGSK